MAQKGLFISANDLKRKSVIDGLVDDDKIFQFIELAQDTHIHRLLGTDLYNKLEQDVVNSTLSGDYLTLVETYIKPMLIWYTQANYLPFSGIKVSNAGAFKRVPENAEAVPQEELNSLIVKVNESADFYTQRFLDYICANSVLFPEYTSNSSDDGDLNPSKEYRYSSWVL